MSPDRPGEFIYRKFVGSFGGATARPCRRLLSRREFGVCELFDSGCWYLEVFEGFEAENETVVGGVDAF